MASGLCALNVEGQGSSKAAKRREERRGITSSMRHDSQDAYRSSKAAFRYQHLMTPRFSCCILKDDGVGGEGELW